MRSRCSRCARGTDRQWLPITCSAGTWLPCIKSGMGCSAARHTCSASQGGHRMARTRKHACAAPAQHQRCLPPAQTPGRTAPARPGCHSQSANASVPLDGAGWEQAGASMLPLQRLPAPATTVSVATTASAAQWHTHATRNCLVRRLCSRLPGEAPQPGAAHAPAALAAPAAACVAPRDTAAAAGRDMAVWPLATCVSIVTRHEHIWHRHSSQPWRHSSQPCAALLN